jgi:Uncharacterized conserved protein
MHEDTDSTPLLSRRTLLGGCATATTVGLAGCSSRSLAAETTVTHEYDAAAIAALVIDVPNGTIDVTEEERATVGVEATKQAVDDEALDRLTLQDERADDQLSLTVDSGDSGLLSLGPTPRMDLAVTVPRGLQLDVGSTNGTITVDTAGADSITAETTNGEIDIDTGDADSVTAETTNGDIGLSVAGATDVQADTTNGNVSITLPASAEPSISYETTNGGFEASGLDAGSIEADAGVEQTLGNGTHQLTVTTTNGDLTIRGDR